MLEHHDKYPVFRDEMGCTYLETKSTKDQRKPGHKGRICHDTRLCTVLSNICKIGIACHSIKKGCSRKQDSGKKLPMRKYIIEASFARESSFNNRLLKQKQNSAR